MVLEPRLRLWPYRAMAGRFAVDVAHHVLAVPEVASTASILKKTLSFLSSPSPSPIPVRALDSSRSFLSTPRIGNANDDATDDDAVHSLSETPFLRQRPFTPSIPPASAGLRTGPAGGTMAFQLTVGQVSAVIAAVTTVLQLFVPTALALLLVGVLKDDMAAVSWSRVSSALHSSYWGTILRADTATSRNVEASVKWLLRYGTLTTLVITVASIITPIGLYDTVVPQTTLQDVMFSYVADAGPFGFGTPGRSSLGFNRQCGYPTLATCPGSDTIEVASGESVSSDFPFGYDSSIPLDTINLFQSGLKEQTQTVSSFFDIQYRTHAKRQDPDINNGTFYDAGSYRQLSTLIINNDIEAVEGLVVDMLQGQVAFRNHTLPSGIPLGATWDEDLLVMEPETQCVNTNLTIDFTLSGLNGTLGGQIKDVVLTDRGGFANIVQHLPKWDNSAPQVNADLPGRAYQSAWLFNVLLAVYYNVTRPNPDVFGYLNSHQGQTFQLPESSTLATDELTIQAYDDVFSTYLSNDNSSFSAGNADSFAFWPNPYNITSDNFTAILTECSGVNLRSSSNMSNVAVGCGLVYGVPRLLNGQTQLIYEPGTQMSMPLMSCASAVKMTVKTLSFRFNGTSGLQSLHVDAIKDRSSDAPPLSWGIENNSGLPLTMQDTAPLWGLVSSTTPESPSLSVVKSPHLYLPGYLGGLTALAPSGTDNTPGIRFPVEALASIYRGDVFNPSYNFAGYSGLASVALYSQWQRLSATTNGTAQIVNMIYTDLAANGLVGTKSWLPASNAIPGTQSHAQKRQSTTSPVPTAQVPVRIFIRQIRYNWLYGVPAYAGGALTILIGLATLIYWCIGRTSPEKTRAYLHATSPGRILSLFLYPGEAQPQTSTRGWVSGVGAKKVRIGKTSSWIPHASQPVLHPEKISTNGHGPSYGAAYPVGNGFAGYETDADPLIGPKTGTSIQLTPLGTPTPLSQPTLHTPPPPPSAFGTPPPQVQNTPSYLPHQGYLSQFGEATNSKPSPATPPTSFAQQPTHYANNWPIPSYAR